MADRKQQYLDILKGYGVDISTLQYAPERQLRQIVEQTRQAPDTGGGEMAVGKAAAEQAAQDVIGGTTPARPLEELLLEAHTGPTVTLEPSMASETMLPAPEADTGSIYDVEPRQHRLRDDDRRPPVSIDKPDMRERLPSGVVKTDLPAFRPTDELTAEAHTGPTVIPEPSMASETMLPMDAAPKMTDPDATADWRALRDQADETRARLKPTLRPDRTPMQMTGQPSEPISFPMVDQPAMPQDAPPGLLSRLGKAIGENPDIALAGMEGIGSLLANIGAARGQRKADEATKQGMARSNLVSALTGGKVRPAVAEETPEMGFLGRLGQAVGTAGKFGREVEKTRYERGFQEEEQERKYDIKEAELQRKIDDDARKLRDLVRKENLDEARIEKWIQDNTRGMDSNDIRRYKAEVYEKLGEGRLSLDLLEIEQGQREFEALLDLKNRGMTVKEALLKLDEKQQEHAFEYAAKEFGLNERRVKTIEQNAETAANRATTYAEQVAIAGMKAAGEQRREVRKMVGELNKTGGELNRMMDPKNGTAGIMQGLNAAYQDYLLDPNTANMNAVFQMYQRLFDPATVREGDLLIQKEGQGAVLNIMAQAERIQGGGFVLARETIENMKGVADRYYSTALKSANNKLDNYVNTLVLGEDPSPVELRQAEALRNYYSSVWNYDPLKEQAGSDGEDAAGRFVQSLGKEQADGDGDN